MSAESFLWWILVCKSFTFWQVKSLSLGILNFFDGFLLNAENCRRKKTISLLSTDLHLQTATIAIANGKHRISWIVTIIYICQQKRKAGDTVLTWIQACKNRERYRWSCFSESGLINGCISVWGDLAHWLWRWRRFRSQLKVEADSFKVLEMLYGLTLVEWEKYSCVTHI
jgi:hypothetical protein